MRRSKGLAVLVLLVSLGLMQSLGPAPVQAESARHIPVGAVLYVWYGFNSTSDKWTGGLGTSHWNDSQGNIVKDTPAIGYYSSLDNNTLAYQLDQMNKSGISWILVSWWGWGHDDFRAGGTVDKVYSAINNATLNLFKYVKATQYLYHFKIAVLVDAFNSTTPTQQNVTAVYNYVWDRFYRPYLSEVFFWEDKPLVVSFNPLHLAQNYTFTYRYLGGIPNPVDWVFWTGLSSHYLTASGPGSQPQNYEYPPVISSDGEVGIIPRYDDFYQRTNYMRFDPTMSLGLYYYEWNYVIQNKPRVSLVLLYGWNEYHERTALEDHADFTSGHFNGVGDTSYFVDALQSSIEAPPNTPANPGILVTEVILVSLGLAGALALVGVVRRFLK
jgi:hypothetical protein